MRSARCAEQTFQPTVYLIVNYSRAVGSISTRKADGHCCCCWFDCTWGRSIYPWRGVRRAFKLKSPAAAALSAHSHSLLLCACVIFCAFELEFHGSRGDRRRRSMLMLSGSNKAYTRKRNVRCFSKETDAFFIEETQALYEVSNHSLLAATLSIASRTTQYLSIYCFGQHAVVSDWNLIALRPCEAVKRRRILKKEFSHLPRNAYKNLPFDWVNIINKTLQALEFFPIRKLLFEPALLEIKKLQFNYRQTKNVCLAHFWCKFKNKSYGN